MDICFNNERNSNSMKNEISKDKKYETRNGKEVVIYTTEVDDTDFQIHGAIKERHGVWQMASWTRDGKYTKYREEHNLDLVEVWRPIKGEWCYFWDNDMSGKVMHVRALSEMTKDGLYIAEGLTWDCCMKVMDEKLLKVLNEKCK